MNSCRGCDKPCADEYCARCDEEVFGTPYQFPLWMKYVGAVVGFLFAFGLSAFCVIAVMELWT